MKTNPVECIGNCRIIGRIKGGLPFFPHQKTVKNIQGVAIEIWRVLRGTTNRNCA